jgi:hypothetical protein
VKIASYSAVATGMPEDVRGLRERRRFGAAEQQRERVALVAGLGAERPDLDERQRQLAVVEADDERVVHRGREVVEREQVRHRRRL